MMEDIWANFVGLEWLDFIGEFTLCLLVYVALYICHKLDVDERKNFNSYDMGKLIRDYRGLNQTGVIMENTIHAFLVEQGYPEQKKNCIKRLEDFQGTEEQKTFNAEAESLQEEEINRLLSELSQKEEEYEAYEKKRRLQSYKEVFLEEFT